MFELPSLVTTISITVPLAFPTVRVPAEPFSDTSILSIEVNSIGMSIDNAL